MTSGGITGPSSDDRRIVQGPKNDSKLNISKSGEKDSRRTGVRQSQQSSTSAPPSSQKANLERFEKMLGMAKAGGEAVSPHLDVAGAGKESIGKRVNTFIRCATEVKDAEKDFRLALASGKPQDEITLAKERFDKADRELSDAIGAITSDIGRGSKTELSEKESEGLPSEAVDYARAAVNEAKAELSKLQSESPSSEDKIQKAEAQLKQAEVVYGAVREATLQARLGLEQAPARLM